MSDPKHPGAPRDVDLDEWLDGAGFHPADTELKQRGHELARLMTATYATHLHQLLPPGRNKSLAFTHLEDVLVRANRALALGGGPRDGVPLDLMNGMIAEFKAVLADLNAVVPYDPRISEYEAAQRGEDPVLEPVALAPFEYRRDDAGSWVQLEAAVTAISTPSSPATPAARLGVTRGADAELGQPEEGLHIYVDDPQVLEEFAAYALSAANQLRALQARD